MKTSELEGALLDYWVAKAGEVWKTAHELFPAWTLDPSFRGVEIRDGSCVLIPTNPMRQDPQVYSPSTDWAVGGPLIEREGIATRKHKKTGVWYALSLDDAGDNQCMDWVEFTARGGKRYGSMSYQVDKRLQRYSGKTQLIAAMRCIVASKFGEEV